jgi:uncharacterized protein (DUF58 family)
VAAPASPAELERAARVLFVRARRAAPGLAVGGYASAFRGAGMEFEESRPYVPGDDLRHLDWSATARSGEPWLKRFREERDQILLLLLDVSASMAFGSGARSKAEHAAHAAALLAAAASAAGDRVGLVAFGERVRYELAPERGDAHLFALVRAAAGLAAAAGGGTDLAAALARVRALAPGRAIVVLLSDLRAPELAPGAGARGPRAALVAAARRHDLVAAVVSDRREEELPASGRLRLADPERPGRPLLLDSEAPRVRERYRAAAAARRRALERRLRADGADVLWLRADRDPLPVLAGFFRAHPGRRHGAVG